MWCVRLLLLRLLLLFSPPDIPGGAIVGSTDERLRLGVDCLMAQVPFWLAGQRQVVVRLVDALDSLNVSKGTGLVVFGGKAGG
jgi:hypothetical protein